VSGCRHRVPSSAFINQLHRKQKHGNAKKLTLTLTLATDEDRDTIREYLKDALVIAAEEKVIANAFEMTVNESDSGSVGELLKEQY